MPSLDLLNAISQQLSLYQDKSESTEEWHGRVLYSALGKLASASLWDSPDDWNHELSVQAFKSKIKTNTEYYQKIVHSNCLYLCDSQTLADEIYSIYKKSGFIYHRANWIYPSICSSYESGDVRIIRSGNPLKYRNMSGLGEYTAHTERTEKVYYKLEEMFALHTIPFAEAVREYIKDAAWKIIDEFPDDTEFLVHSQFRKGYWCKSPSDNIEVSLLRVPLAAGQLYYLYRESENGWEWSQLPAWLTNPVIDNTESKEWLSIATGLLMLSNSLPTIDIATSDKLITITIPYLLPPAEEAFFELYSWPLKDVFLTDFKQHYTRKMSTDIFPIFEKMMKQLGYKFTEVS